MAVILAGERITAGKLNALVPTVAELAADQPWVNSTLALVTGLVVPVAAGVTYDFEALLFVAGVSSALQDVKVAMNAPAGSTVDLAGAGPHLEWANSAGNRDAEFGAGYGATTFPTGAINFGTVTGAIISARVAGQIVVGANAGNLEVWAAQQTTNATATTVKARSKLRVWRRN